MFRILAPFVFIVMPVVEIIVFILVGREIGVLPTIGLTLATSVLGVVLVRRQGLWSLRQLREDARAHRVPATSLGRTVVIALAGVLLILPGFVTDAIGLLLFIPFVRGAMWRLIASSVKIERVDVPARPRGARVSRGGETIDLTATEVRRDDQR